MIRIFEVGPRDGLQNEAKPLSVQERLDLIEALIHAGIRDVEVGAFVRPDRVPQMAGTEDIFRSERLKSLQQRYPAARFWALVPNEKGLDRALASGAPGIAVFGGATETFVQKNIGMSIEESLHAFRGVVKRALDSNLQVRGYVSVCWICPYEGEVQSEAVLRVVQPMLDMGIPEISLGDTIGRAHPMAVDVLLNELLLIAPASKYAVHFHDTYGMALANIDRSIKHGITVVDSSIGGLGGCPYAPGAAGNVATEDVYSLMEGYSKYGIAAQPLNPDLLYTASALAQKLIGRSLSSKRLQVWNAKRESNER